MPFRSALSVALVLGFFSFRVSSEPIMVSLPPGYSPGPSGFSSAPFDWYSSQCPSAILKPRKKLDYYAFNSTDYAFLRTFSEVELPYATKGFTLVTRIRFKNESIFGCKAIFDCSAKGALRTTPLLSSSCSSSYNVNNGVQYGFLGVSSADLGLPSGLGQGNWVTLSFRYSPQSRTIYATQDAFSASLHIGNAPPAPGPSSFLESVYYLTSKDLSDGTCSIGYDSVNPASSADFDLDFLAFYPEFVEGKPFEDMLKGWGVPTKAGLDCPKPPAAGTGGRCLGDRSFSVNVTKGGKTPEFTVLPFTLGRICDIRVTTTPAGGRAALGWIHEPVFDSSFVFSLTISDANGGTVFSINNYGYANVTLPQNIYIPDGGRWSLSYNTKYYGPAFSFRLQYTKTPPIPKNTISLPVGFIPPGSKGFSPVGYDWSKDIVCPTLQYKNSGRPNFYRFKPSVEGGAHGANLPSLPLALPIKSRGFTLIAKLRIRSEPAPSNFGCEPIVTCNAPLYSTTVELLKSRCFFNYETVPNTGFAFLRGIDPQFPPPAVGAWVTVSVRFDPSTSTALLSQDGASASFNLTSINDYLLGQTISKDLQDATCSIGYNAYAGPNRSGPQGLEIRGLALYNSFMEGSSFDKALGEVSGLVVAPGKPAPLECSGLV